MLANSAGFEVTWLKNSTSETVIIHPLSFVFIFCLDKFLTITKLL